MAKLVNKNLKYLCTNYKDKKGVVLEGSSRSGKTWSSIYFIVWLCARTERPLEINIVKETYASFKTTLYSDFDRILKMMKEYSPFEDRKEVDSFKLLGSKINLLGADKPSKFEGAGCDFLYINEGLNITEAIFKQAKMRCRQFWWMDYNPKYTKHWVFDSVVTRDDVGFLKTTYEDNPYISDNERNEIQSYEPTKENIRQGTASSYDWNVFGLGLRSAQEGLVFQEETNWILEEYPDVHKWNAYGLDFGFTNDPTALVEICSYEGNIHVRELAYNTGMLTTDIADKLSTLRGTIIADSASPLTIADLNADTRVKANIYGAKKGPDSINNGINIMKKQKLYIDPKSLNLLEELRNYTWAKDRQGTSLNKPVDKYNHLLDALRYIISYKLKNSGFRFSGVA